MNLVIEKEILYILLLSLRRIELYQEAPESYSNYLLLVGSPKRLKTGIILTGGLFIVLIYKCSLNTSTVINIPLLDGITSDLINPLK